ncbi:unnamed protein product, partial [Ranitomeya imitator]
MFFSIFSTSQKIESHYDDTLISVMSYYTAFYGRTKSQHAAFVTVLRKKYANESLWKREKYGLHTDKQCDLREILSAVREKSRMGKKVKKELEPPPKDVFDPLAIESKKAETAVLMLQSPEEEILAKSCDAIYKFARKGDENKITLLGLGAMESLSKLISHEDKIVRRNATMVCGIMAAHSDVRRLMQKLDMMPSLIFRLAPE